MHMQRTFDAVKVVLLVLFFISTLLIISIPLQARAAGMSTAADAMCTPWYPTCGCNQMPDGKGGCTAGANTNGCPVGICVDHTNGATTNGICAAAGTCKAQTVTGLNGKSTGVDTGLLQLGQALGGLLSRLIQSSSGSGSGSGSGAMPFTPTGGTTCTSYYSESTNPAPSDPCAYYVAPVSNSLTGGTSNTTGQDLLNALNGGNTSNTTDTASQLLSSLGNNSTSTTPTATTTDTTNNNTNISNLIPGVTNAIASTSSNVPASPFGTIVTSQNGATIQFTSPGGSGNTVVAGFLGGNSTFGASGIVANWCATRPWTTNFLSSIVPPPFFDGLCKWAGYQVGVVPVPTTVTSAATPNISLQQSSVSQLPSRQATASTTVPAIPPKVLIWAVPAAVPIGSRTTVYWNTQGVSDCTESSPDGSFNENSLQGGASTVPLSGATTYSISCQAPDGTPVTGYVTVDIQS